MDEEYRKRVKLKLFITQFLLPQPIELLTYLFVSLLLLLVASNQTLLVILSDGSPVPETGISDVFSQRLGYLDELMQTPILGRIILFLFWLAIGSVVYMMVWLFQNIAVEVYDDIATAKLKERGEKVTEGSWWGTTIAHTIFVGASIVLFIFYVLVAVNLLMPAWVQLFKVGLVTFGESGSFVKLAIAVAGTMFTTYVFLLFWRLFFRLKNYIYNSF